MTTPMSPSKQSRQAGRASRYGFRAVTEDDLPMIAQWLDEPHLAQWWGDPHKALAEIKDAMEDVATEPLIIELDGEPIGYLQSYDPHLEDDHPYQDQPTGTLGIDLSIGKPDLVGKGHGSAIVRQFVDELFAEGRPARCHRSRPDERPCDTGLRKGRLQGLRHAHIRLRSRLDDGA